MILYEKLWHLHGCNCLCWAMLTCYELSCQCRSCMTMLIEAAICATTAEIWSEYCACVQLRLWSRGGSLAAVLRSRLLAAHAIATGKLGFDTTASNSLDTTVMQSESRKMLRKNCTHAFCRHVHACAKLTLPDRFAAIETIKRQKPTHNAVRSAGLDRPYWSVCCNRWNSSHPGYFGDSSHQQLSEGPCTVVNGPSTRPA